MPRTEELTLVSRISQGGYGTVYRGVLDARSNFLIVTCLCKKLLTVHACLAGSNPSCCHAMPHSAALDEEPKVDRAGGTFQARHIQAVECGCRALEIPCSRHDEHISWQSRTVDLDEGVSRRRSFGNSGTTFLFAARPPGVGEDMKGERRVQLYELLKEACVRTPGCGMVQGPPAARGAVEMRSWLP